MKRRFSLLINIATLVLCVSAIAIGVYSAKTASLNVGGSIGFTAHNCKASVSARVKNDAVKVEGDNVTPDAEGTLNENYRVLGSASVNEATGIGSLSLGNIFFTDLTTSGNPETIVLEITITNLSDFAITIDLGECGSTNENVIIAETSSKSTDSIETKDGTSVFTFNISLNKVGEEYPDVSYASPNLTIKFNVAKKAISIGYNVNIQTTKHLHNNDFSTRIKFDTAPADEYDYDFFVATSGDVDGTTSLTKKTKMYIWSGCGKININTVDVTVSNNYSSATCIELTQDSSIIAYYYSRKDLGPNV